MTDAIFHALLPVVLVIALGGLLRQRAFVAETFWPQAERLSFYILLPCLLFQGLATADLGALPVGPLAATLISATLVMAALVVALRRVAGFDGPAFTSVFQGSIRFNNYVGVTLAAGLFGGQGVALAAICNAALIPTVNILCVLIFARHGSLRMSARDLFRQLLTNPLLVGSFGGIAFQVLGIGLPPGIGPAMKTLGAASLPLGLLCVGAALELRSTRRWLKEIAFSSAVKFMAVPGATLVTAHWTGLNGPALTTALLFSALPTASSAYIMARQLGGDAPLMAGITAVQTMLALAVMPAVLIALSLWLPG